MGRLCLLALICFLFYSCGQVEDQASRQPTLFKLLSKDQTGVDFVNLLEYTEQLNTYTYKNFYSGGGVGLGDFNNDGLIDIFFSGNLVPNKLYLNKGNLRFEDISESSGVCNKGVWTTGVSIADVNADGLLDIYLCKSGPPGGSRRYNELFINNGDLTFTDKAKEYGLAFEGLSTHASFFDFDKDGDLDCYLLNNSIRSVGGYDLRVGQRNLDDPLGGNKLLRNDNGKFVDISRQAGIFTSEIGFGLGVTVGDMNKDGWPDIYVSNDFFEKDYLYINNQDGTFRESLEDYVQEISLGSMGADMADINNDGLPEIFVTEMLPEHDDRLKTTTQFESWDKYTLGIKSGYFRQFSRNVLQLNNGNGTFSEISRLAGVHATDWSWGALIFDMDNDGMKDIFVANGIYKDLLNQDYVNYASNPDLIREIMNRKKGIILQLIDSIPSTPLVNYAFHNSGNLTFVNKAEEWGMETPTFSNGSAYGDLDNDGDLDIVLNNVNMPSMVYENRSRQLHPDNSTLSLILHGEGANSFALGTKVTLKTKDKSIYQEVFPMRGFMSTVDNRVHMGLGKIEMIDSLIVEWPDNKVTVIKNIKPNQYLNLFQKDAETVILPVEEKVKTVFSPAARIDGLEFVHTENEFVDFDRDRLLFNMVSNEGPCLCSGDFNGDGRDDFYIGGAKGQAGSLFVQQRSGAFDTVQQNLFDIDKESEDTGCIFFDANGDGRPDLYVTSGGSEFSSNSTALADRLYLTTASGHLEKSGQLLPVSTRFESTSTVAAHDYDNDGDVDLFVGVRLIPFLYGIPANGYILNNNGKGVFKDVSKSIAPQLEKIGMITDAEWTDVNNDGFTDLLIVGDWMPVRIFMNENGKFSDRSLEFGLHKTNGWYNSLAVGDFNNDGYADFVTGNHGLNSRFKASEHEPVSMYISDFDGNGSVEHITTRYDRGVSYPFILRQDLLMQIPSLKKKYVHFRDYKEKSLKDIFGPDQLKDTSVLHAYTFETAVWMNTGKNTFVRHHLPDEAQFFPVYDILIEDFNDDGNKDVFLAGNQFRAKPEIGIYAGGYGGLFIGNGSGGFRFVNPEISGVSLKGEVRSLQPIKIRNRKYLLIGKSNDQMQVLTY